MGILGKFRKNKIKKAVSEEKVTSVDKKQVQKIESAKKEKSPVGDVKKEKLTKAEKVKGGEIAYKVLLGPVVTEKSAVVESENKYSFLVDINANKLQIKMAVQEAHGIMPISVKTINMPGKIKRYGRNIGRRSDYKKAIVSLPKGKTINVHEGV